MADAAYGIRQMVLHHGRVYAREAAAPHEIPLVKIASEVLGDEKGRIGYSYSGLCLTSLPHRKIADDQPWQHTVGPLTLLVEPGRTLGSDGKPYFAGVPYGARARLILIYLQTQAVLTQSREVSLGRSMREWMGRMGISVGGETVAGLREQARRITHCSMQFFWVSKGDRPATVTGKRAIINTGLFFHDRGRGSFRQDGLFEDRVLLDSDFFDQLRHHPVPILDAAVQQLKDSSTALDIYVWLAYRLHHLERRTAISWRDLHQQFGAGYRNIWQWKPRFVQCLAEAVAAYPEAEVDVENDHVMLHPSPPPVKKLAVGF